MRFRCVLVLPFAVCLVLRGQDASDVQKILDRLERLEQQNRALTAEVRALRDELASGGVKARPAASVEASAEGAPSAEQAAAPLEERMAVQERRVDELSQTKVETERRYPVTLTGTVLFNAFLNGQANGGDQNPVIAAPGRGISTGGATLRQTVLGLRFQGPEVFGGGKVSGSLFMDFFAGSGQSLDQLMRLRVASLDIDWKTRSLMVGQEKPILAPREPNSLAQVGVSPLTGAGNLWLWEPQARVEQRFHFGDRAGLRAQLGIYETNEGYSSAPGADEIAAFAPRPALQGRFEFWRDMGDGRRLEIAPGFHTSTSHMLGQPVPSNVVSVDWLFLPVKWFDFSGTLFRGENMAVLGGLRQGFTVRGDRVNAVRGTGGWAQLSFRPTKRVSLNMYGGQEDDRDSDLLTGAIAKNQAYAGNVIYRLGPNVLASAEISQTRTKYVGAGARLVNHYDLALAYSF
jgi:hypothetical protein